MAILGQVVQEVSSRLEQHIALRSSQCWQQITRDPAFSSPEQYCAAQYALDICCSRTRLIGVQGDDLGRVIARGRQPLQRRSAIPTTEPH